ERKEMAGGRHKKSVARSTRFPWMSIPLPQILRPRPPTTPSRRLKSDPRVHDIVVYPLFCEGLICSFRAGEGLDRGEIAERVASFLIGLPPHLVVVSERVFQPRSERSRT